MKTISAVVFLTFLAACCAGPLLEQDFSTTDENGGYHFGYNGGYQARQEKRTPDGIVRGAYSYIDANGETQTITYTADDKNGFLASGSNIPKVPEVIVGQEVLADVKATKAEVPSDSSSTTQQNKVPILGQIGKLPGGFGQILPVLNQIGKLPGAGQVGQIIPGGQGVFNPAQIIFSLLQQIVPRGEGYPSNNNQGLPVVQYIISAAPQYHPDYQPYAAL